MCDASLHLWTTDLLKPVLAGISTPSIIQTILSHKTGKQQFEKGVFLIGGSIGGFLTFDAMYDCPYRDYSAALPTQAKFLASPLDTQFYNVPDHQYQPGLRFWTPHRNVWERLTDHQYYTGSHRERFDEFGKGRGLAGREYVFLNDGMTESATRCHEVFSSSVRRPRKPVVEPGTLGIQRFGVQTIPPKLMWLYRNGDKHHQGTMYFLRRHVKTMQAFYQDATKAVVPLAGPVRKIFDQDLRLITNLEDIIDGGKYLCSSGEPPAHPERLEKFFSTWVIHNI